MSPTPPVLRVPPTSTGAATTSLHFSAAFSRTGHQHFSQRNSPYIVKDLWQLSNNTWKARIVLSRSRNPEDFLDYEVILIGKGEKRSCIIPVGELESRVATVGFLLARDVEWEAYLLAPTGGGNTADFVQKINS
ncbi:hypothetical protein SLEP1_g54243 [Rubroshorea leprosula]|uniref:Uncharacterized protein n=1 Tax=Rubroshorea leprosula TaxID=152421 RepID=A0AAV5MFU4_9ROSI|nr:hypothetical protein SLEP1_g54243 [Rubroshorea leprosula]